jgi:saccharopine dehydrogenase-like NADP-dependent oxidoreductase
LGNYAFYPNRDSLTYSKLYQLEEAENFIRTTLRHPEFCKKWQLVIEMGLTDTVNSYPTNHITYYEFFKKVLITNNLEEKERILIFLQLNSQRFINEGLSTPAFVLQKLLETQLSLRENDRDLVIMQHEIVYTLANQQYKTTSTLTVKGENSQTTAMAKTVGIALGVAAKFILEGKINEVGLHIPIKPSIYLPMLDGLKEAGICFTEQTTNYPL